MRPITIKVPAGGSVELPISGEYLRNGDTSPTISVEFRKGGDDLGASVLRAADAVQVRRPFDHVRIYHGEATEQTITIDAGFGELKTSRVAGTVAVAGTVDVAGTVTVVNSQELETIAGNAFQGGTVVAATSGQYSHAQLWNPAASGVNLKVNQLWVSTTPFGRFSMHAYDAPLAAASVNVPESALAGASMSSAELRYELNATPKYGIAQLGTGVQSDVSLIVFSNPVILRPGYGLGCLAGAANVAVVATWLFTEEAL